MKVLAWSPHLTKERAEAAGVDFAGSKEELFKKADIVSIHLVLSDDTRHLVTLPDLLLMKPSAFIINTSRGPLIEEKALIQVLNEKTIAGAGLDVFDLEPLELNHPLREAPNVTLTPHMAYVSDDAYKVSGKALGPSASNF
jgi:phosphoglycerate dehydrogenase-like enzyme